MTILIATDGSAGSNASQSFLRRLRWSDRNVELFAAIDDRSPRHSRILDDYAQVRDVYRQELNDVLESHKASLEQSGFEVKTTLTDGPAVPGILQAIEEKSVDLLVLGHHGLSAFERFFAGSVTQKLAHRAPCSVLVVREGPHVEDTSPLKILLAYDDTSWSEKALDALCGLNLEGVEVTVVRILELLRNEGMRIWQQAGSIYHEKKKEAHGSLLRCQARLESLGAKCHTRLEEDNDPGKRLVEVAEESGVDMIVCGHHRDRGLERFVMGNTVNRLLHAMPSALWIVR